MRVFINTFGSRGDVQPFVALGKGLQAVGHDVTICTASTFESIITDEGLNYGYMTDEALKLVDTDAMRGAMEDTVGVFGSAKTMMKMMKLGKELNRQMVIDSVETAKEVAPELVIYHPKALGAVSVAEKFDAPIVMVNLQPMLAATGAFPPIGIPELNLGSWFNKLTYKAIPLGYRPYGKDIREIQQAHLGVENPAKSPRIERLADGTSIPIMHAFSRHVVPPPADWPAYATVNGYWFLDQDANWEPSPELQAFLDGGEPPVYVGFGSMAGRDPERVANIVVEALQQASVRGIVATGWGGMNVSTLPETIFKIEKAPHAWLFPRMAAVVHHGGAGTTAAGLRAGRPTVVCPFFGDQPFWGKRINQLGVGPAPIPLKKLSAEKLAAAMRTATTDITMQTRAAVIGEQLRAEDGVANALARIEEIVKAYGRQKASMI